MLDPLTDIRIGVFMTIRVSRCQLVVDILSHGKWCQAEHGRDDTTHHTQADP
jgi:hypothetical protein